MGLTWEPESLPNPAVPALDCFLPTTGFWGFDLILFLLASLLYLTPIFALLVFFGWKRRWHFMSAGAAALVAVPIWYHASSWPKYDGWWDSACGLVRDKSAMTGLGWLYFCTTLLALAVIGVITGLIAWRTIQE